jgi:hypothetical protein
MWWGETDPDAFDLGEGSQMWTLRILLLFSCFVIMIHLMNMLIAIMGNTFNARTEVGAQIMTKEHLRYVMDNWLYLNKAL